MDKKEENNFKEITSTEGKNILLLRAIDDYYASTNNYLENAFISYNNLNIETKKNLPFVEYFKLTSDTVRNFTELMGEDADAEFIDDIDENPEELNISKENLCKKCNKKERFYRDRDFCTDCITILNEEAEKRKKEIIELLFKDLKFLALSSEISAIAYVKNNYEKYAEDNKFIFLTTIAKETYALKKLNN